MNVYLKCSRCGKKRKFVWNLTTMPDVHKAVAEGWRSVDGKLVCAECLGQDELVDYASEDVIWTELLHQLPARRK